MISFTDLSDGAPPEPLWLVRVCINDRDKDTAAVFATHGGLWRCVRAKDAPNSVAAMMAAKATAGRVPGGLFARWIRMRREDAPIGMAVAVLADKVITGAREGARYAIKGDSVIATVEPSDLYPVQFRIRALKRVTDDTIKGGVDQ
jgi:hypothetical protein